MDDIFRPADILLPNVPDLTGWSTVACDQFTSQGEYWDAAQERAGDAPSAMHLMLPEAWLGTPKAEGAAARIAGTMERYLREGIFREVKNAMIYLERTQPDGRVRRGLVGVVDLEAYDYAPGSRTPIRATEGTVTERLPPRVKIRRGAPLEMPHTIVLADDREDVILGTLAGAKDSMEKLYDFELMLSGGHVRGWLVAGERLAAAEAAIRRLGERGEQRRLYGSAAENGPLTIAVGDGNHSLAAAKAYWNELRRSLPLTERASHPARFALAELENIHDPALDFEPIHRLLTGTDTAFFAGELAAHRTEWEDPARTLGERVAAAETFCQRYVAAHGGAIDYIHGEETALRLAQRPGSAAVLLPPVEKDGLFLSVLTDGVLPRKSFSMGQAEDKRYYLECRRIR